MAPLGVSILLSLLASASSVSSPWRMRGVYADRPGMPSLEHVAASCGVPPPLLAPKWVWALAWRSAKRVLPLLHARDPVAPSDTCVNLMVVWLKALSANRPDGVDDGGVAYAFLPERTREVIGPSLAWLYPRLHHQNIAMRSAFLERTIRDELAATNGGPTTLIALGAGFDGRSLRYASPQTQCCEIDLPEVVEQKRGLVARAVKRLPHLEEAAASVTYIGANLSDVSDAWGALRTAMTTCVRRDGGMSRGLAGLPNVILVCEALMIYLPDNAAERLLRLAVEEAKAAGAWQISLCFADALPGISGVDMFSAQRLLRRVGLDLDQSSWTPKPGLARHMGVARLRSLM